MRRIALVGDIGSGKTFISKLKLPLLGFAFCSLMSGNAESIPEIMFFRGLQGMFSAPIVPISQALMLDSYPRERHGYALAIWGTGVMFAPVMGPVIGGWLTDELSWRWVFYVSTPFAILTFILYVAYLNSKRDDLVWQICLSSILCAYSKPSFITIFLPLTVFHAILSQIRNDTSQKTHRFF